MKDDRGPAFKKRDRVLERLNEKWGEEDERRNFFDLTHKPGEHGGLSLIPWFVRHRKRGDLERLTTP